MAIKYIKWQLNISNGNKIHISNGHKEDPMAIKHANIFHFKTIQNLPKFVFLV
jgi:hypothetical protein